jgi:hypothetical protein
MLIQDTLTGICDNACRVTVQCTAQHLLLIFVIVTGNFVIRLCKINTRLTNGQIRRRMNCDPISPCILYPCHTNAIGKQFFASVRPGCVSSGSPTAHPIRPFMDKTFFQQLTAIGRLAQRVLHGPGPGPGEPAGGQPACRMAGRPPASSCEIMPVAPGKANLIATLGHGEGGLVLAGHTDTVPCDRQLVEKRPVYRHRTLRQALRPGHRRHERLFPRRHQCRPRLQQDATESPADYYRHLR